MRLTKPDQRSGNSPSDKLESLSVNDPEDFVSGSGFSAPTTPDNIPGFDLPPHDPTDVSSQELSMRYAYSQAMLACASRILAVKRAQQVILKSKITHYKKRNMFLNANTKDQKWKTEARVESTQEYDNLAFELTQVEAYVEIQTGVVAQYTEVSKALSREQSRRGDEMRARLEN